MAAIAYNAPHSNSRKSWPERQISFKIPFSKVLSTCYARSDCDSSVSGYKRQLFAPNPRKSMRWTSSPSTDSTVNYKIPTYPVGQRSLDSRHTCRGPPRKEANHCLKQPTNGQSLTFWQLIHFPFPTSSSWRAAGGGETIGIFVIRYRPSIRIARYHSSMLSTMRKRQQSKESQDHQPKSRKTIAFGYSSDKLW